jgi:bleomycin hydrolase
MQKLYTSIFVALLVQFLSFAPQASAAGKKEKNKGDGYQFTPVIEIPTTPVKDQANTGTCWSFATTSFIETEILRLKNEELDLSEMYFVHLAYPEKAKKYMRYQGMANFSEGGQAHDVMKIVSEHGFIPESVYSGKNYDSKHHQHTETISVLKGILDNSLKNQDGFTGKVFNVIDATLDIYLGEIPQTFNYNEKEYTTKSFATEMGFNANDYIEFTAYSCYPMHTWIDLEIPDNWSHDTYFNLTIDELMQVVNYAFENGFSVNWDGDMSEAGFSHSHGVAIIPETDPDKMSDGEKNKWNSLNDKQKTEMLFNFSKPRSEKNITMELRQKTFDMYKTTDDHLMHLVGTAKDQNGTNYYLTKNSWGDKSNKMGGYLYMSESYLRLKTIAIQVHKDAIPEEIRQFINP